MSIDAIRERVGHLRAIPLPDVLRAAGACPDPHDKAKWHTARGVLSLTGAKFFNWNEARGGGGAIDLAMHLNSMDFKDAVHWLARLPAASSASQAGRCPLPQPTPCRPPNARPLALPVPVAHSLPAVLRYLNGQRRLPLQALRPLIDSGLLYADRLANAVFILRNHHNVTVGAELRGTGSRHWRGMAPGSRKELGYFAVAPPRADAVILCESAIDAISCRLLHSHALCVSTSGATPDPAWLLALFALSLPIYCGFDADPAGDRIAQSMIARHPALQRLRPPCHDWNDSLRARS